MNSELAKTHRGSKRKNTVADDGTPAPQKNIEKGTRSKEEEEIVAVVLQKWWSKSKDVVKGSKSGPSGCSPAAAGHSSVVGAAVEISGAVRGNICHPLESNKMKSFSGQLQALVETNNKDFTQKLKQHLISKSSKVENPFKFIVELFKEGVLCDGSSDLDAHFGFKEMLVQLAVTIGCSKGADGIGGLLKALESSGNFQLLSALKTWAKEDLGIESNDDDGLNEPEGDTSALQPPPSKKLRRNGTSPFELSEPTTSEPSSDSDDDSEKVSEETEEGGNGKESEEEAESSNDEGPDDGQARTRRLENYAEAAHVHGPSMVHLNQWRAQRARYGVKAWLQEAVDTHFNRVEADPHAAPNPINTLEEIFQAASSIIGSSEGRLNMQERVDVLSREFGSYGEYRATNAKLREVSGLDPESKHNHPCHLCGIQYKSRSGYWEHARRVHVPSARHDCEEVAADGVLCLFSSVRYSRWREHMLDVHGKHKPKKRGGVFAEGGGKVVIVKTTMRKKAYSKRTRKPFEKCLSGLKTDADTTRELH